MGGDEDTDAMAVDLQEQAGRLLKSIEDGHGHGSHGEHKGSNAHNPLHDEHLAAGMSFAKNITKKVAKGIGDGAHIVIDTAADIADVTKESGKSMLILDRRGSKDHEVFVLTIKDHESVDRAIDIDE